MHPRRPWLLLALCALWAALPLSAQDDAGDVPLLDLLGFVPDADLYREFILYGDLALWHESWGIDRIDSVAELEQRSDADDPAVPATLFTMTRQTNAPEAVGYAQLMSDDMRGYLGIDLLNTDRFIEAGSPPNTLTIIESSASDASVRSALTRSGYAESALGDATLFSKGEDFQQELRSDAPLVARLAMLNRVALLDDTVLISRATAGVEGMVAAASGDTPSLAENDLYRAAALAVSDADYAGEGALVGALFEGQLEPITIEDLLGARATPELIEALREALDIGVPIYTHELAVFASRRRANDSQLLLALVYPPGTDAQTAADVVLMRMKQYTSLRTREPLLDIFEERGVAIEWGRGLEIEGQPVALISLSARNPTLREDADGRIETYIFSWADVVYARDLGFIASIDAD